MSAVVYLHPEPRPDRAGATYPVLPVGAVAHMNALVAAGVSVRGLNLPVERVLDPAFSLEGWMAAGSEPALVFLDLHWYEHAAGVVDTAARVRRGWPGARIVVGGLTATRFAEELLALCPAVDAVVAGDAEAAVLALARGEEAPNLVSRGPDGRPVRSGASATTPQATLDAMDSVSLGWLAHADAYRRMVHSRPARLGPSIDARGQWLINGRGCAFECLYCGGARSSHQALSGLSRVLKRDPATLARDVARLQALGVQQVALTLDPDMLGRRHQDAFFEALTAQSTRPGLYVESFQLPSVRLLDHLARRADPEHSELAITPLSGDETVRWRNGKRYDNAALLERLDALAARDLSVFVFFSLNLPGEDAHTLEATVALAERILDRLPPDRVRVMNICHTLDPASPLLRDPDGHGVTEVRLRTLADYVAYGQAPRPFTFEEGERGFVVPGRDLRGMVQRWDEWCLGRGGGAIPVPRV
ncbi:MAG: cobalamin B12-binding domain-containing protein [Alphaproteobacteria bacterium]|nr:cobalamin B12-binding domain-containing protein [Alphaproteobacteria bacterium]